MKTITIFILLLLPLIIFSQTREIETKNFTEKYLKSGKFTSEEGVIIGAKWQELLEKYNGYPELPYDTVNEKLSYEFVHTFESFDKKTIFSRIFEWAAINFGGIEGVIKYSNSETGKIILQGSFDIIHEYDYKTWDSEKEGLTSKTCFFTYTFTISGNKVKFNVSQIFYEYSVSSLNVGGHWTTQDFTKSISQLYPITNYVVDDWKDCLDILVETNESIHLMQLDVVSYIEEAINDYDF